MNGRNAFFEIARWTIAVLILISLGSMFGSNRISDADPAQVEAAVIEQLDMSAMLKADNQMVKRLYGLDPAFERSKKWYNIPEWSAALEKACASNGILFANCDSLAEDYPNLWDPDGIHFREQFYPYWASAMLVATLMEEG